MTLKFKNSEDLNAAWTAITTAVNESRFQCVVSSPYRTTLKILDVRLRERKLYCGNHPASCEIGNHKEKKARFLEGADWVEFNDLLNDQMDRLSLWCNIDSSSVRIRKGFERRILYSHLYPRAFGNAEWVRYGEDEDYGDYCGKAPPEAEFPEGTPGRYKDRYAVVG